jgi:hypothetical protein
MPAGSERAAPAQSLVLPEAGLEMSSETWPATVPAAPSP